MTAEELKNELETLEQNLDFLDTTINNAQTFAFRCMKEHKKICRMLEQAEEQKKKKPMQRIRQRLGRLFFNGGTEK